MYENSTDIGPNVKMITMSPRAWYLRPMLPKDKESEVFNNDEGRRAIARQTIEVSLKVLWGLVLIQLTRGVVVPGAQSVLGSSPAV